MDKIAWSVGALLFVSLAACSSPAPQILTSQNPPAFTPGEYVTKSRTIAAIDSDSFRLAIVAFDGHDTTALQTLRNDGRVFNLPVRTRLAVTSTDANISGATLCSAEIESGSYVGSRVVIPCESVAPDK